MGDDNMSQDVITKESIIHNIIQHQDFSALTAEERTQHLLNVCDKMGLDPLTKPFEYIKLNNKLTLYCTRAGTDQLRNQRGISIKITNREVVEDVYTVSALAITPEGRQDESIGAVSIAGLRGDARANACMKAETKAKRRVTLSICGLGMLDESELETIHEAKPIPVSPVASSSSNPANKAHTVIGEVPNDPSHPANYVIEFGKYKGKTLAEVDRSDLENYRNYILRQAEKENKQIYPDSKTGKFLAAVKYYLSWLDGDSQEGPSNPAVAASNSFKSSLPDFDDYNKITLEDVSF